MANWTNVSICVVLETKNIDRFLSLFEPSSKMRFYRAFIGERSVQNLKQGISAVYLSCSCAWSAYSSFFSAKKPSQTDVKYVRLDNVIKALNIKALVAYAKEEGIGFEESFEYEATDGNVRYKSRDLFRNPSEVEGILNEQI